MSVIGYTEEAYAALEAERDELKSKLAYATLGFDKLVVERDALRQRCEGMGALIRDARHGLAKLNNPGWTPSLNAARDRAKLVDEDLQAALAAHKHGFKI